MKKWNKIVPPLFSRYGTIFSWQNFPLSHHPHFYTIFTLHFFYDLNSPNSRVEWNRHAVSVLLRVIQVSAYFHPSSLSFSQIVHSKCGFFLLKSCIFRISWKIPLPAPLIFFHATALTFLCFARNQYLFVYRSNLLGCDSIFGVVRIRDAPIRALFVEGIPRIPITGSFWLVSHIFTWLQKSIESNPW